MKRIGVWNYLNEFEQEREDILEAVDSVFSSGRLVLGPFVERFERRYANWHGREYCISVDNGTNALVLALRALGIGPGDDVVTVSNTAAPTVLAIDQVGARPVFVDVDRATYLMDTTKLAEVITERTRCILPVHLFGQCVRMGEVNRIAAPDGIAVLEDCAQAHGALHYGRLAGTMSEVATFSFYPTKVLGAYGDGGAILTDSPRYDRYLRRMRYYGMESEYRVIQAPGHNSRLDAVQAEILSRKLARLEQYIARRQAIAQRYAEGLQGTALGLPTTADGNEHVYYLYVVRHPERERVMQQTAEAGIDLNISYPWPVHTMAPFADSRHSDLSVTEQLATEIFSLPMYPSLSSGDQDRVIEVLRNVI